MNASQKVTAAAMALVITLIGAVVATAPATLPAFAPASSRCNSCGSAELEGFGYPAGQRGSKKPPH